MKTYSVSVDTTPFYVEVEATDEDQAKQLVQEALERGECTNQADEVYFVVGKDIEEVERGTKVKFVIFKDEVVALFPEEKGINGYIMSYQHVGQHGDADKSLLKCKKATPEQYKDLKKELEEIGYSLIVI